MRNSRALVDGHPARHSVTDAHRQSRYAAEAVQVEYRFKDDVGGGRIESFKGGRNNTFFLELGRYRIGK